MFLTGGKERDIILKNSLSKFQHIQYISLMAEKTVDELVYLVMNR
jgi:hypothetical protein